MKKAIVPFFVLATAAYLLFSNNNVGIGTPNPNQSAILDLEATDKGLGFPTLTTTQRDNIQNPKLGLTIYNLTDSCLQTWNGAQWKCNSMTIINNIQSSGGSCEYCLMVDTIMISPQQINFLGTNPVQLVPSPGPGYYWSIKSISLRLYPGANAYSFGGELKFFYDPLTISNQCGAVQGIFCNGSLANTTLAQEMQPQYMNGIDDVGIYMRADYNPFPQTGDGYIRATIARYKLPI